MLKRSLVHLRAPHLARPSSNLAAWTEAITKQQTVQHDTVSLARVQGLISTIELAPDGPPSSWVAGSPLPPGFSLLLFPPTATALSSLNPDGTEPSGPFHPPSPAAPLPPLERMWVSGSWDFLADKPELRVGDAVESRGVVESVKERVGKDGRKGVYVTARREVGRAGEEGCMVERRTHLYRPPLDIGTPTTTQKLAGGGKAKGRRTDADFSISVATSPEMLFRFSALTFNTHRIHWDLGYCLNVERREGLIVHGPLTSLLLLSALRHNLPSSITTIKHFSYRATSPLVVGTDVHFCGRWDGKECEMWTEDGSGKVYMAGKATVT